MSAPAEDRVMDMFHAKEKETTVQKCSSCGSNMVFEPEKQCLYCEHCGSQESLTLYANEEQSFASLLSGSNTWSDETHVFQCTNCGAKEILAKTEISKFCSFCGTTNVVQTEEISGLKPNAVVPFRITKDDACDKVTAWAKKKIFAPKKFKQSVTPEEIAGTYSPAFTFDTDTTTHYRAVLGKYYYVKKKVNGKEVRERKIRYFTVSGTYGCFFDDILIQASSTIKQKTVEKLQPFETNHSAAYAPELLYGYTASQYSKDGQQCWQDARRVIDRSVKAAILRKYDYDVVSAFSANTHCKNITYKYMLLPIYVGHCNWRTKLYNFFVNGFNGKVTGKTPLSPVKVGIASVLGAAVLAGIILLVKFASGS